MGLGRWKPTHDAPSLQHSWEASDDQRFIRATSKNRERSAQFAEMLMRDPDLLDPYNNSYIMPLHEVPLLPLALPCAPCSLRVRARQRPIG